VALYESGELQRRAELAWASLARCELCPHRCAVDRRATIRREGKEGALGRCRSGALPVVASHTLHPWEEPPISGRRGSGTIFFSGCTGRCRFCQNYPISQLDVGRQTTVEGLAGMMLKLQERGAHNVNFVTPTHWSAAILAAMPIAVARGLRLPLLYNCSGYERVETLRWLEDVIDIWLPDSKYADDDVALRLSGFPNYVEHNRAALLEMYRQVGDELTLDEEGIARRGMIVRHMVLPGDLAGTERVLQWIAANLSTRVHVSLMSQYFPAYKCVDDPLLGRKVSAIEYERARERLHAIGLEEGWVQEPEIDQE
jgi:putative pyruvate formate lyase activating enzyme